MNQTISQQIMARHAKRDNVQPGEIIFADVDLIMSTDGFAGIAKLISQMEMEPVALDRFVAVVDHHMPANTIQAANLARAGRLFAGENTKMRYFDVGRGGIGHHIIPERGLCRPGQLIIGADSHTCTYGAFGAFSTGLGGADAAAAIVTGQLWFKVPESYKVVLTGKKGPYVQGKDIILSLIARLKVDGAVYKAIEFTGDALPGLDISDRVTICNMVVEMGAKAGIFEVDDVTLSYFKDIHGYEVPKEDRVHTGSDESYEKIISMDISSLEPVVAVPDLPSNVRTARELTGIKVDQAFLGSCTNGRIEDMRMAAALMKGHKVHPGVRLIVLPGTQRIMKQMIAEGIADIFLDAGAIIGPPTCGPCAGVHMGILADGEVCISSNNRNFMGRMGSPKSSVYLANPAVVAAAAIKGEICHPEEVR